MNPRTSWAEQWRTLLKQEVEFTPIRPVVSLFLSRRFSYALMRMGEQRLPAVLDANPEDGKDVEGLTQAFHC